MTSLVAEDPAHAPAEVLISIDNVRVVFPPQKRRGEDLVAVDVVTFGVSRGERVVILGPSGCGKSTLLRAAGGFVEPTQGDVLFEGVRVSGPSRERIPVFQETDQLLPWKTVIQNVSFAVRATRGVSRHEARDISAEWLVTVGLGDFLSAYPYSLSGGMRQRVAVARAFATDAKLLLMDEPFAALDALSRRGIQTELNALWASTGVTILLVTHSIQEALTIGDRVIVMSARPGRILDIFQPDGSRLQEETWKVEELLGLAHAGGHAAPSPQVAPRSAKSEGPESEKR